MNPSWVFGFPWWEGAVTVSGSNEPKLGSQIPWWEGTIKVSGSNELKLGSRIPMVGRDYYGVGFQ